MTAQAVHTPSQGVRTNCYCLLTSPGLGPSGLLERQAESPLACYQDWPFLLPAISF